MGTHDTPRTSATELKPTTDTEHPRRGPPRTRRGGSLVHGGPAAPQHLSSWLPKSARGLSARHRRRPDCARVALGVRALETTPPEHSPADPSRQGETPWPFGGQLASHGGGVGCRDGQRHRVRRRPFPARAARRTIPRRKRELSGASAPEAPRRGATACPEASRCAESRPACRCGRRLHGAGGGS
jgi:hypothetical protein